MANTATDHDTLSDFVRRKRAESSTTHVDWDAKRDNWIAAVEQLYAFLRADLLKSLIDEQVVEVSETLKRVSEDHIGAYTIPELNVKIGGIQVVFSPKGFNVVGAEGRIDLRGDRDTVTILLSDRTTSNPWSVIVQRVPKVVKQPLDSETLKWALERVML